MSSLPVVHIRNKFYCIDLRLLQVRNVRNPNDFFSFKSIPELQRALDKRKAILVQEKE